MVPVLVNINEMPLQVQHDCLLNKFSDDTCMICAGDDSPDVLAGMKMIYAGMVALSKKAALSPPLSLAA